MSMQASDRQPRPPLAALAGPAGPAVPPDAGLAPALEAWRSRLAAAGVSCSAVAFSSADPQWTHHFAADATTTLDEVWTDLRTRVSADNPVALGKLGTTAGADLLMATSLLLPNGQPGIVGAALQPPHNERAIQLVLLSLGWLQLALAAASLAHNQRAAQLLELLGHVASQREGRAAAQDWINRSAAWVREAQQVDDLSLSLFEVRDGSPRWWVGADTAWAEAAAAALQAAGDLAAGASVEMQEVRDGPWWALPLLDDGEPTAVLVAHSAAASWPPEALAILRGSAALAEPLLRRWREAEASLPRHAWRATRAGWRKLTGPGHLTWKAGAAVLLAVAGVLLLWPVPDRVTANLVIEGRVRQVVTAPFEGFIARVLVRPGERVTRGQVLAALDERNLKLEQGKHRSERDQAAGKLRQAMAERDASAMALAAAEQHQAEAQLALVEARLERAALLAPLDGLVVSGDWAQQIGGPVETGKEMFEIAATDGYRVVLHVTDHDIARVRVGQTGALRLTGQPHASHAFRVSNVTATASVQDATNGFRVEAAWDGPSPSLSPGMQGVGKIVVGEANLLTIWTRSSIDWLQLKLWTWW
ncbi:MAG: HlyD family efflux transporter periplasmic adaptor subunit [Caldimonas sp.]